MSDFKSKLPDLKELTSMSSKLFHGIKNSVNEIIDDYKKKRVVEEDNKVVVTPTPMKPEVTPIVTPPPVTPEVKPIVDITPPPIIEVTQVEIIETKTKKKE